MTQLLKEAFEKANTFPQANRTDLRGFCWPNSIRNIAGPSCLVVQSQRICWNDWQMKLCRHISRDEPDH